jgi:nitrate/TMAO reductase-like tetraheme cytochrome c subunit
VWSNVHIWREIIMEISTKVTFENVSGVVVQCAFRDLPSSIYTAANIIFDKYCNATLGSYDSVD